MMLKGALVHPMANLFTLLFFHKQRKAPTCTMMLLFKPFRVSSLPKTRIIQISIIMTIAMILNWFRVFGTKSGALMSR